MADTDATVAPPAPAPVAIFKKRGAKGQANLRKRAAAPPPAAKDSDDDSDSDFSSSEDEAGFRIKRRKKNPKSAVVAASSRNKAKDTDADIARETIFEADRNRDLKASNDATKTSNWFDESQPDDLSAQNLLGSVARKKGGAGSSIENATENGLYKGLANQKSYIQKNPDAPNRTVGPIKAPSNIRTITITDMAPDVCKDYKLTGWCGFGDNCKFAHVREDYAHGWQLDKEWENVTKGKKIISGTTIASAERKKKTTGAADPDEDDKDAAEEEMLQNIPFACIICKGPYKSPIVTRCGHYFCEACALRRYRRDPGCAACGSGTNGVFNAAKKLNKLLERKKERAEKRRQEAIENGEEVSDEEGGGEDEDDD
ncbi:RNA-splicing factor [Rhypophila decipiens]